MIMNMDSESNEQRFKGNKGIGLYKVNYEMDVKGSSDGEVYTAGVIAYSSEEAIKTLSNFSAKRIKGFKGMKINELAFEGLCHAMSDKVKKAVIRGAIAEGKVVSKQAHQAVLSELEDAMRKPKTTVKRSIVKDKS
jgi:hypothetical protein